MKCPACPDSLLVMTERSGVEIDYCPTCRGVWLDRGELDKIVERATSELAAVAAPAAAPPRGYPDDVRRDEARRYDDDRRRYDDDDDRRYGKKRKRSSIFEELFDF